MSSGQDQERRVLELVFHSANHLPKPSFSIKAVKPYVIASIISPDTEPDWAKTVTDEKGGENPVWDYVIRFPLTQQTLHMARNFNFVGKIMHSGTVLGNREIGDVKVPLPILLALAEASAGEKIPYPVVVSGRKERGEIFISHRLFTSTVPAPRPPIGVQDRDPNPEFLSVPHSHNQSLELIFHSAIGIPSPRLNRKGSPYVLAAIVGLDAKPNWVKTVTHERGGKNPVWDYVIRLPLNEEKLRDARNFNLICKIMHSGSNLGDREIGRVKVRLQDFIAGAAAGEDIRYPVVSGGGEKGTIVISHRLVAGTASAPPQVVVEDPDHGARLNVMDGVRVAAAATVMAAAVVGAL